MNKNNQIFQLNFKRNLKNAGRILEINLIRSYERFEENILSFR